MTRSVPMLEAPPARARLAWGPFAAEGDPRVLVEDLPALGARLEPEVALGLAWHLAAALAELHERGEAHGALHPSAIGLDLEGRLLVLVSDRPAPAEAGEGAQATDCARLAPCLEALRLERLETPGLGLVLSGLRRTGSRLRLQPGRAVRQALSALLARHPGAEAALVRALGPGWRIEPRPAAWYPVVAVEPVVRVEVQARVDVAPVTAEAAVEIEPPQPWVEAPAAVAPEQVVAEAPAELEFEPAPAPALELAEPELEFDPAPSLTIRFHPEDQPPEEPEPDDEIPEAAEVPEPAGLARAPTELERALPGPVVPERAPPAEDLPTLEAELEIEIEDDLPPAGALAPPPAPVPIPEPPPRLAPEPTPEPPPPQVAPLAVPLPPKPPERAAPPSVPPAPETWPPDDDPLDLPALAGESPRWGEARGVSRNTARDDELGMGKWTESARPLSDVAAALPELPGRKLDLEPPPARWGLVAATGVAAIALVLLFAWLI